MIRLGVCVCVLSASALAQTPAINDTVDIDQSRLLAGDYSLREVLEAGRHFFSTPYLPQDGYGEGHMGDDGTWVSGPRQACFEARLAGMADEMGLTPDTLRTKLNFPPFSQTRFLRLNGLDSQSCFECHNSIGSDHLADTTSSALARKVSVTGGTAGFASTAFINPLLPDPMILLRRNPPHVFGTGYVQRLADEMTFELRTKRCSLIRLAMADPGTPQTTDLVAKGIDFGTLTVTYDGSRFNQQDACSSTECNPQGFTFDYRGLQKSVSCDLVVRPLQWKGNASSERNFVKDALEFHFGILAVEKHRPNDPDPDLDGVDNEMSIGNVTALTAFTVSIRPPQQIIPPGKEAIVERGRQIFTGEAHATDPADTPLIPPAIACASCHTPSLQIYDPNLTILTPDRVDARFTCDGQSGLTQQRASTADLPVMRKWRRLQGQLRSSALRDARTGSFKALLLSAMRPGGSRKVGDYGFNLTTLEPNIGPAATPPSFSLPRLPANPDGTIDVPLFSDLRRHDMGVGLSDSPTDGFEQGTDVSGLVVSDRMFLTRSLWGLADSAPYLHDGRALTIRDAILAHKSEGSEANASIDAFLSLSDDDQQAVIEFLLTQRLPPDPRYNDN